MLRRLLLHFSSLPCAAVKLQTINELLCHIAPVTFAYIFAKRLKREALAGKRGGGINVYNGWGRERLEESDLSG